MWTDRKKRKTGRKLSREILEFLLLSFFIAAFSFCFLYFTADSVAYSYLMNRGITANEMQWRTLHVWLYSLCGIVFAVIWLFLFLFMLGQRLAYLVTIIKGVEELRQKRMNYELLLDGEDELTELAASINFLAQSQREISRREKELKEEREAWIRSLSHDIRTPLTSMMAYSEFLKGKGVLSQNEMEEYISLMQSKTEQIKILTEQLMDGFAGKEERIDNVKLLIEQLAQEWEELLEERFCCQMDFSGCKEFSGSADVFALRRIFDNLASNVEKYADSKEDVYLKVVSEETGLVLIQGNKKKKDSSDLSESRGIGLQSIRQIAGKYEGDVKTAEDADFFEIQIFLNLKP